MQEGSRNGLKIKDTHGLQAGAVKGDASAQLYGGKNSTEKT